MIRVGAGASVEELRMDLTMASDTRTTLWSMQIIHACLTCSSSRCVIFIPRGNGLAYFRRPSIKTMVFRWFRKCFEQACGEEGEMAEWFKAHAWKVCVPERVPGVRIPLSPPISPAKAGLVVPDRVRARSHKRTGKTSRAAKRIRLIEATPSGKARFAHSLSPPISPTKAGLVVPASGSCWSVELPDPAPVPSRRGCQIRSTCPA